MKKHSLVLFLLFWISSSSIVAQTIIATASPTTATQGESIQLTFQWSQKGKNFQAPDLSDFDVISGPNQSSSVSISNGTTTASYSYSYLIAGKKTGIFIIQPASIEIDNKIAYSKELKITIQQGATTTKQNQSPQQADDNLEEILKNLSTQQQQMQDLMKQFSGIDSFFSQQSPIPTTNKKQKDEHVFLRSSFSTTNACIGEPIILTYKVYSAYPIHNVSQFMPPAFDGFYATRVDPTGTIIPTQENLDGNIYNVADFVQYILLPQQAGNLSILAAKTEVLCQKNNYDLQMIEAVSKKNTLSITKLPTGAPIGYDGAVGKFRIQATINPTQVAADEQVVTLKVTLSGTGNIHLINKITIQPPTGIELPEPTIKEDWKVYDKTISGEKTFTYEFVPRQAGSYAIPAIVFSYYDTKENQYQETKTLPITITVTAGKKQYLIPIDTTNNWQTPLLLLLGAVSIGIGIYLLLYKKKTKNPVEVPSIMTPKLVLNPLESPQSIYYKYTTYLGDMLKLRIVSKEKLQEKLHTLSIPIILQQNILNDLQTLQDATYNNINIEQNTLSELLKNVQEIRKQIK